MLSSENIQQQIVGNDIVWRVVRINEDGSIRLISENNISSKVVWNSTVVANYINDDGTDSEIKSTVENWYNNNIGNNSTLDSKVVTSSFCNDISGNYEAANTRVEYNNGTPNPIFTCPSGARTAYSKAGLLTADELVYGGALKNRSVTNNITYLKSNQNFWTLTPQVSSNAFNWSSGTDSILSDDVRGGIFAAVRAVINLKSDVTVSGGDGLSTETAYVIQ